MRSTADRRGCARPAHLPAEAVRPAGGEQQGGDAARGGDGAADRGERRLLLDVHGGFPEGQPHRLACLRHRGAVHRESVEPPASVVVLLWFRLLLFLVVVVVVVVVVVGLQRCSCR